MMRPDRYKLAAFAVVSVAAAVRLYGIDWGLPHLFEEATPLRRAWEMWGWGAQRQFDPNPHFFNYPSLMLYVHFVGQGLLLLGMKLVGAIDSTLDARLMYLLERTPFVVAGRLITTGFALGTVWLAYAFGRRVASPAAGLLAAFCLAVNASHVAQSQLVSVDVPLTFFVLLSLWFAVRLVETPDRRCYVLTGIAAGLALSTKYTGVFLVVPVVAAHFIARRVHSQPDAVGARPSWRRITLTGVVALATFALTSPYVFLDFPTFWNHMLLERQHMTLGHFGLDSSQSWLFYARALSGRLLGWPLAILSAAGLVRGVIRRRPWALILGSFVLIYWLVIGSWEMKADRYALPLLAPLILFASAVVADVARIREWRFGPRWLPGAAAAVLALAMVVPVFAQYPAHFERLEPDTRVAAGEWIEAHVPAGSFIVWEYYGPDLLQPVEVWSQDVDVRRVLVSGDTGRPLYAVQTLPMLQFAPERCGVFYDLSLYEMADYVITTSNVRGRYESDRTRFARQVAFYRELEATYDRAIEFGPDGMTGPTITVYRNPRHDRPFAQRRPEAPRNLDPRGDEPSGQEGNFYYNFGLNYEAFRHYDLALDSYMRAFRYPMNPPARFYDLSVSVARTLGLTGRSEQAVEFLDLAVRAAPTPETAARLESMRAQLLKSAGR
jgi:4-amino-4-deoxy-L-arabinose transferase-like glycosyltransferase